MYTDYLHGIDDNEFDVVTENVVIADDKDRQKLSVGQKLERGTRVSLTIRHVPKTLAKFKLKFWCDKET